MLTNYSVFITVKKLRLFIGIHLLRDSEKLAGFGAKLAGVCTSNKCIKKLAKLTKECVKFNLTDWKVSSTTALVCGTLKINMHSYSFLMKPLRNLSMLQRRGVL